MAVTFQQLIDAFINGDNDGYTGTEKNRGNLRLESGKLIHYSTVIAERIENGIIINVSRYSLQTGRIQKMLKESIPEDQRIIAKQVPKNYKDSLRKYI